MGGTDQPENIVEVTVTQHAMFHFCNYQLWGNEEDKIAWRALSGLITPDEAALEAMALGTKKGGKISGNKTKENKTGIFSLSPEERSKNSRKVGNKAKENKTGICGMTSEEKSEAGKKGGKISGNKHKENKTGIFARSPEKMTEDGKKATSQKWQCTETGYVSNSGGLTCYQNKRGIDTSNRIKVDGPRRWEITFEDGRVIVITQTLKEWAEENGYSYDCLLDVRRGKIKKNKGIIKIVSL